MTVKPAYVCRFRQASLACLILATFLAILGPNIALEDYFCRRGLKLLNLSADSRNLPPNPVVRSNSEVIRSHVTIYHCPRVIILFYVLLVLSDYMHFVTREKDKFKSKLAERYMYNNKSVRGKRRRMQNR